jgi:FkbM family methyltransferase
MKPKSLKMKIGNFMMHLDPLRRGISGVLWGYGYREPCFMWIIKKEAYGKLGVDLGANLGYGTLHLCNNMDKVIAIEPDRRPRKLLKMNIKENGLSKKVEIYKFAISNKNGEEIIYLSKKNPNLNTLCDKKSLKKKKDLLKATTIKTRTLDSLNIFPNFVKMDIEGYEVEAIQGGMKTFRDSKDCKLLIEVHPQFYDDKRNFAKILYKLFNIGYDVKYVVSAGCECPNVFKDKGYSPFKVMKDGDRYRGLFKNISKEDAVNFCAFRHPQETDKSISIKAARSILLVKNNF